MTRDLFADAVSHALARASWRAYASGPCLSFTRRQALHRARKAEARIVNIAIAAECAARLTPGGPSKPSPVPNFSETAP